MYINISNAVAAEQSLETNFIHFSGTQMLLLDYEETASLGDRLYPSNSAGQVRHCLEPWPYQAPVLAICL